MLADVPSEHTLHTPLTSTVEACAAASAAYTKAQAYLAKLFSVERLRSFAAASHVIKLDRSLAILRELGDPHRSLRCIHVAGSKGKGSVVEMAAAALTGCGYGVGVYTSPHLVSVRERIRIGAQMISEADFALAIRRAAAAAESAHDDLPGGPTFFEIVTAAAFDHFARQAVDAAVIEVGLGGRLDCTNTITPLASVITALHLEHTDILGPTIAHIAREKAGIIKHRVPVLTHDQHADAMHQITAIAHQQQAPLHVLGRSIDYSHYVTSESPTPDRPARQLYKINISHKGLAFEHVRVPLPGEHQCANCALALAAVAEADHQGLSVNPHDAVQGLARTYAAGRLEHVLDKPTIVIDGAHTPESVAAAVRTAPVLHRAESIVVVFSCARDKRVDEMLRIMGEAADGVVFTAPRASDRARPPIELHDRYRELTGRGSEVAHDVPSALRAAARIAEPLHAMILVTGSFYLAGEAKAYVAEHCHRSHDAKTTPGRP